MPDFNDDALKVGIIVVLLCFASALAAWDPESILDGGNSPVRPDPESGLSLNVSSLDWGVLQPGGSAFRAVLIQNMGAEGLFLGAQATGWNPEAAAQFLNLSWDQEGTLLDPGENVAATFQLKVSPLITEITDFSFQIDVYGNTTEPE